MTVAALAAAALPLAAPAQTARPRATLAGEGRPELVASYVIQARLDPGEHRIDGSQTVHWRNRSRRPVGELCLHLYLNAFRNRASSWLRHEGDEQAAILAESDGWGWIELTRLEAGGYDLSADLDYVAPDDGNPEDRTLARVALPRPLAPGESVDLRLGFIARLPRAVARTGYRRNFHLVAQWFPKLGVLEPDGGWSCHQFHRSSEFYADFGDYDVTLTVPRRFVVGATGERKSTTKNDDGTVAYRYVQQGVHDFAWTAWPGFVERRSTFRRPGLPEVELTLLLRPDAAGQAERYRAALEHGLQTFGEWLGPYPYSTLTLVDPPWGAEAADGMEYPTLITTGTRIFNPPAIHKPEGVTIHELGHQFFYGLLASDEVTESWLDEGVNTWASYRVLETGYGRPAWHLRLWGVPLVFDSVRLDYPEDVAARYFRRAATDPVTVPSWGYLDRRAYRALTYSKTAIALGQLERMLGAETMERAVGAYAREHRFRHPTGDDFVRSLSRAAGRDLAPFFRQVLDGSEVLDYAVESAETAPRRSPAGVFGEGAEQQTAAGEPLPGWQSVVVVRRLGGVRLPVTVELVFADGSRKRLAWDGEARWVRYRITGPRLLSAEVDPDRVMLLDVDRLNNGRRTAPDRTASRRWGQRARFWIQNLLESFAALA